MERREALRMLRAELGMTQSELANAVHVGFTAVSRWENKNSRPNRASSIAILELAKKHRVSPVCLDGLTEILLASRVNDKADKALTAQVTERMQLEKRILLTSDRMRTMLDNLDLAVIGHRIFASAPEDATIIYSNRTYAAMFGYPAEEFSEKSVKSNYCGISDESRKAYKKLVKQLLAGDIQINDFSQVLRGCRRDGTVIWLEIKGISLEQFSYGWDFFISCRDITTRIEAERKYAEEIAVRDASLQGFYASMHFDLDNNTVFRQRDIEKLTGKRYSGETADKLLDLIAESILADNRETFREKCNRAYLTQAFAKKNTFDNVTCFDTVCEKWMRFDCVLIGNPYTRHPEAVLYVYDIHAQMIATKLMHIVGDRNFDYIGILNNQSETFESFYYSPTAFQFSVGGKRDYRETCAEKLQKYVPYQVREAQRDAVSIETIHKMLGESAFYTAELRLIDRDNTEFLTKVTYRYLDETKSTILIAQHKRDRNTEPVLYDRSEGVYEKVSRCHV